MNTTREALIAAIRETLRARQAQPGPLRKEWPKLERRPAVAITRKDWPQLERKALPVLVHRERPKIERKARPVLIRKAQPRIAKQ